jgi:hypothetical protein
MNRSMKIAGISAILIATTAFAQDGVKLKFTAKKDEVVKMRLKGTVDFGGMTISVSMLQKEKVVAIGEDGTVTTENEVVDGKIEMAGNEMEMPASPVFRTVRTASGDLKEIQGEAADATTYRGQIVSNFFFPEEAVKVGSKWTKKIAANKDTGGLAVTGTYEVLSEEQVLGKDCFKIKAKNIETEGDSPAAVEGTYWMAKDNSGLYKATMKWINYPLAMAPAPLNGEFTLIREN